MEDEQAREVAPLTDEELADLPVFPLPRVVFFPGSLLPLHLFEMRYRQMIEDCVKDGPRALIVAMLDEEHLQADVPPTFRMIAGAGRIIAHEARSDGTHDIVLQGLHRVRVIERDCTRLYRRASATPIVTLGTCDARDVSALLACANHISAAVRKRHPGFELGVDATSEPALIADTIADRLVADPEARQTILEATDVGERIAKTTDALSELMGMLAGDALS